MLEQMGIDYSCYTTCWLSGWKCPPSTCKSSYDSFLQYACI